MTEILLELLKELKIEHYCINEERKESFELFFVKKALDLVRSKDASEVKLTVYRDFTEGEKTLRGSSDVYLYPQSSREEMKAAIASAFESAGYVKNPFFDLPDGTKDAVGVIPCSLAEKKLSETAYLMAGALFSPEGPEGTLVNSAEIYARKNTKRIVTSKGTDVSYTKYSTDGEFVVQCKTADQDVEFYRQFAYDELNTEALSAHCLDALVSVKDRKDAVKAPEDLSGYKVILCDDQVRELMQFYLTRANASMIYPGYSTYEKGSFVQEGATAEKLNLDLVPKVPYSDEGVAMTEKPLLTEGVLENIHGRVSFSAYIGAEQTGTYSKINCKNGSMLLEDMKKEPYLMVKNFSDFQVDAFDGHFGGEFRLAYLFDGETVKPVTGGTISCDLFEAQKSFVFSQEKYQSDLYSGPKALMFHN